MSCVSEGEASYFYRIVYAVGLQLLVDVIGQVWAFAVGSDVSTDDFSSSHLDVRVQCPGIDNGDNLFSFHLLVITLFD